MRILMICDARDRESLAKILVKEQAAVRENILHVPNFEKANEFRLNQLEIGQGHVDLIIIADQIIGNNYHVHLVDEIRAAHGDEYSCHNFKMNQLPIILYGREIQSSDHFQHGFNGFIEKHDYDNQRQLINTVQSVVKEARAGILDDLDMLKIDRERLQNGFLPATDAHYTLKIRPEASGWAAWTKILSESFIRQPRRLDYDWLVDNRLDWEMTIDRYMDIIQNLARYDKVNSEKRVLHSLYNQALWLLRLDVFGIPYYEPGLMKSASNYEEPDYVLPSSMPGFIPTNILEIKPHLLPILQCRKRKPGFKRNFQDAMIQISDYERHVRKGMGRKELNRLVDYKTSKLSFTLLASNDKEQEMNLRRIEELRHDHYPKITTETHNDRLRAAIAYYERNQRLHVLN